MAFCSKCGIQIQDGAKFCPKCGNPCGDTFYPITEGNPKYRKPLFVTLAVLIVLAMLGGGLYFFAANKTMVNVNTISSEQILEEKKLFLESFYKKYDSSEEYDEAYIKSNVTNKALQILKTHNTRDEGGDDDPNGIACWLFNYFNGWVACGSVISRDIISQGGDIFLVSTKYEEIEKYEVELSVIKDGNCYKIDDIKPIGADEDEIKTGNNELDSRTGDISWLQGHWVYEGEEIEGHVVIQGDKLKVWSNMNPEPFEKIYKINGDEINAGLIDGMDLFFKIDFNNHSIDYGNGNWMHKVSDSNQNYSSSTVASNTQKKQRPFTNEQDIMARLYNQRFIHNSGLEIKIDSYGRIEIDGDPAGVLSVLRYNSNSALLRYGNGMYGEGKVLLKTDGNRLFLQDTVDGAIFSQR